MTRLPDLATVEGRAVASDMLMERGLIDVPLPADEQQALSALWDISTEAQLHELACRYAERVMHLALHHVAESARADLGTKRAWMAGDVTDEVYAEQFPVIWKRPSPRQTWRPQTCANLAMREACEQHARTAAEGTALFARGAVCSEDHPMGTVLEAVPLLGSIVTRRLEARREIQRSEVAAERHAQLRLTIELLLGQSQT